jgi:hypothetical protein
MKRAVTLWLVCVFALQFAAPVAAFGLDNDEAAYIGGTESQIQEGSEGSASIGNRKEFVFESNDGQIVIPYDQVNDLEYGQKAGRRVGLAIAVNPLFLLSKHRRHFLTIGWKDEKATQHAAVFELGKSIVRTTITTLESKTGKKVDYQDDDARKSLEGI